ncbi:hypothetical protein [Pedobacter steynii]|uniref:Uncharacterized protein n=1 Tax=Pedobacter steynii TaxID=430522 RepID=A0A1D7QN33_9SPHI|nr:hypothetical protein [Pedobacter steynii]AOM80067.1 hypothetical protein BFS30_24630 [Pedobacter steynii]
MENEFNPQDLFDINVYKSLKGKEAVSRRVDGLQPVIDIKGQPYFINVHFGLLEPANNFLIEPIRIGDIQMDQQTKKLSFYFDTSTKERVDIDEAITELPGNVVRVELPNLYYLDPIGMARRNEKDLLYYKNDGIPLRMYRVATIIPLQKTELLAEVNENRKRSGMEPLQPGGKGKQNTQKKRRMGL